MNRYEFRQRVGELQKLVYEMHQPSTVTQAVSARQAQLTASPPMPDSAPVKAPLWFDFGGTTLAP